VVLEGEPGVSLVPPAIFARRPEQQPSVRADADVLDGEKQRARRLADAVDAKQLAARVVLLHDGLVGVVRAAVLVADRRAGRSHRRGGDEQKTGRNAHSHDKPSCGANSEDCAGLYSVEWRTRVVRLNDITGT